MASRVKRRGTERDESVGDRLEKQDNDRGGIPGNAVRALQEVLRSRTAPAAAKATAARTLAEIEGKLGRHQQAPVDRLAEQRVSLLCRVDLERELARLRTVLGTGDKA